MPMYKGYRLPTILEGREIAPGIYDVTGTPDSLLTHKPKKNLRRIGCECDHCESLRQAAIARRDVLWLQAVGIRD